MEWEWFYVYFNKDKENIARTNRMINYLTQQGYRPYQLDGVTRLKRFEWMMSYKWGVDVLWIKKHNKNKAKGKKQNKSKKVKVKD